MSYTISGVDPTPFKHLFGLSDEELSTRGAVRRHIVDGDTIPERTELREAPAGSDVLLVNFTYQPANNPYRGSHAIFLREGATDKVVVHNSIPEVLRKRFISLRAFDKNDMLVVADTAQGTELEPLIEQYFARPEVAYLHAHYAGPGCFAAYVTRG